MDDFRIYNNALTTSQVGAIYANGNPTAGLLPTSTRVQVAAGATLDLAGHNQTVVSLSDVTLGSGGIVTNSGASAATLTLAPRAARPPSAARSRTAPARRA